MEIVNREFDFGLDRNLYRECENCYKIEAESLDTKEKIIDYINNAVNTIPLT